MLVMKQPALPAGKVIDVSQYGSLILTVSGITGGTITLYGASRSGGPQSQCGAVKLSDFTTVSTITADGNYELDGLADFQWALTTPGIGTPTVDVIAKG